MTTKFGIFNGTLALLGQRELTSLNDPVESRRVLERLWDNDFVRGCLEQGNWNFALRAVSASAEPTPPAFGYQYRFEKPTDWVRTVKISSTETFKPPLNDYVDEDGHWYANVDPIYVQFVSTHPSYGGNIDVWPRSFSRYVEHELAVAAAPRLLAPQELLPKLNGPQGLLQQASATLRNAKSKDAQNQPPEFPPTGSWARSRSGFNLDFTTRK